jgi:hypothetical protein
VSALRFGRRGFGFGHLFGLLFLARHPILLIVIVGIVVVVVAYQRRRRR